MAAVAAIAAMVKLLVGILIVQEVVAVVDMPIT